MNTFRGEPMKNMILNISISEREYSAIKAFADHEGETIASFVLRTVQEKIEDWEDVRDMEEILSRKEKTYTLDEVKAELKI